MSSCRTERSPTFDTSNLNLTTGTGRGRGAREIESIKKKSRSPFFGIRTWPPSVSKFIFTAELGPRFFLEIAPGSFGLRTFRNIALRHSERLLATRSRRHSASAWSRALLRSKEKNPLRSSFDASTIRVGDSEGHERTFHESLYYDKQVLSMLPSSGILHIDHIECVAVESTKWMLRFPIKFDDLKNAEQRRNLACLTRRSKNIGAGELWLDIQIGDKTLLQSEVAADSWVPPRKGQLAFEIIVYVKDRPLSPDMFIRISEELSQQENEAGRQQLLQAYLSEGRPLFTSEMVAILMEMFRPGDSQWNLFRSLCGYTIDPFNHIFTCFHLLDKQKQKLVRRWLEEGKKF